MRKTKVRGEQACRWKVSCDSKEEKQLNLPFSKREREKRNLGKKETAKEGGLTE